MRLGIPENVALLSLDIFPDYQKMHATAGTADPSDLSLLAYNLLSSNKHALYHMRNKLHQVVLDEYQDVSVSQHALLRLVVRGLTNDNDHDDDDNDQLITYDAPKLFCAGDSNQSIYGWRGASPALTVSNFMKDYPMGVVVPLGTCYRLPRHLMDAANALLSCGGDGGTGSGKSVAQRNVKAFQLSPAGIKSASKIIPTLDTTTASADIGSIQHLLGEKLLSSLEKNMEEKYKRNHSDSQQRANNHTSRSSSNANGNSIIFIQGLWDAREEAKYIATSIRRQFKERLSLYATATAQISAKNNNGNGQEETSFFDPTDVAIMVRSTTLQMTLFEEALTGIGIPYQIVNGYSDSTTSTDYNMRNQLSSKPLHGRKNVATLAMKPIKLMTMHRAKGDEFDEVYLAGWNEKTFPHPASVSTNRLNEERRLAYVALTRARQRVVITYSFVRRVLFRGDPNGSVAHRLKKRYVTEQVEPSRFLYELMPAGRSGSPSSFVTASSATTDKTVWSRKTGFKEIIAGTNLPPHFAKSYKTPLGYKEENVYKSVSATITSSSHPYKDAEEVYESHFLKSSHSNGSGSNIHQIRPPLIELDNDGHCHQGDTLISSFNTKNDAGPISTTDQCQSSSQTISSKPLNHHQKQKQQHLKMIESALQDIIVHRVSGCCTIYKKKFRDVLKTIFYIERGTALVLSNTKEIGAYQMTKKAEVDALLKVPIDSLSKRPLSQCTAMQLGHYLAYLILKSS